MSWGIHCSSAGLIWLIRLNAFPYHVDMDISMAEICDMGCLLVNFIQLVATLLRLIKVLKHIPNDSMKWNEIIEFYEG